ncbi:MAG: nicotinate-nucleotide diphosphorylase (carboxylating), partial [Desulfovibrio sp.]|nr:nicotinate-nucleotide diphosphorylase (carboxylating) [Desulfovibrio sp.]
LPSIPKDIEVEVSGNVTKDNIRKIALISPRRPNFISVGRLTHSAKSADFSMTLS